MDRFNGAAAAAAMQFSPAHNNNPENFLLFDSSDAGQHSPTSSLDLDSFNPSSLTADISAFFDHDHDQAEAALSQDMLLATDRWSGTTTTTNNNSNSGSSNNNNNVPCNSSSNNNANSNMAQSSRQAQAPQSSSPSQCQSSVSQGQSSNPEGNSCNQQQQQQQQLPPQPYASSFDKSMWDASHSSADVFAMQQQQQRNQEEAVAQQQQGDHPNSGRNNGSKAAAVLSPKEDVKKRAFSALHTSSGQAVMCPMQQQVEPPDHHQAQQQQQQQPQVEGPGGGLQAGYMRQQQANCSDLSPQESAASQQAAKNNTAQPMDYEQSSQTFSFNGDSKMTMHPNHNENIPPGAGGGSMYHRIDSESQQSSRFQGVQQSNNMIFQRASANAHVLNTMQQGDLQNDLVMQNMQRLGIPMQGLTPQLQEHIMNLRSPVGNNLALSAILQNQAVRQGHIQMPSLSHAHGQGQGANQSSPINHQAFVQSRNLLSGLPQQVPFHLARASPNQLQQHALNSGSQLAGMPHLTQIASRAQGLMPPGMRFGNRHALQGLPSAPTNYPGNPGDMVAKRMPGNIAFRCVEIIMHFMQEQRKRPQDNSIVFWRKLVQDFYAPVALERWCLSSYSSSPMTKNAQGLFPMEYWLCNICGKQPGRGFEYSTDVLPRLLKIKYDSGLLDELLFLESPEESYVVHPGKLVVEFPHAVHESVFQELRVVRNGRLRVSFNNSLKILSWEFCCESHCEAVPRKNLLQQTQQLSTLVNEAEQEGFDKDPSNLKNHCSMFTACAKQLKGKLEAPNVNDLGFSKRHVRCLQIAEVVNSMKDLISFERRTGLGPIESLNKFPTIRKMQAQGSIPPQALNQVTSQLPQAGNPNSQSKLPSRLPVPARQTLGFNQTSPASSVLQGNDPLLAKISTNVNPMQAQLRSNLEQRSLNMMQPQANGQMQPPSISHLETSSQGQSDPSNQYLSHFTSGHSPVQGQHLGHLSSPVSGLVSSQNTSHLSQQPYDQGVSKQMIYGSPNQIITQSRSLNRTGQQSLPGTPQSELSDMRSNP